MKDKELQYAYLAGLIDGEGTITVYKHQQHMRPTFQLKPRLIVSNTHQGVLNELVLRHGGYSRPHRKAQGQRSASFQWRVFAAEEIHPIIQGVMPYLLIKRHHADLITEFIESRRLARGRSKYEKGYTPREMDIYQEMSILNLRGAETRENAARIKLVQSAQTV
jgi:hypothetical protein